VGVCSHTAGRAWRRKARSSNALEQQVMPASTSASSDDEERDRKRSRYEKSSSTKHAKEKKKHKHKHSGKDKKHKHTSHNEDATRSASTVVSVSDPISEEHYFKKAPEFQLWLTQARSVFIDELSSEEARRLFAKFCRKWNNGELAATFYAGLDAAPAANRTRHQWGFAASLSGADQLLLDRTADGVSSQTNKGTVKPGVPTHGSRMQQPTPPRASVHGASRVPAGPIVKSDASSSTMPQHAAAASRAPQALPGSRLAELQAKERERMDAFRRQMGLG